MVTRGKSTENMERFTCCCCFDADLSFNSVVACPVGHVACGSCMERALEVSVGDRKMLTCLMCTGLHPLHVECNLPYDELAIARSTRDQRLRQAYDVLVAEKTLASSEFADPLYPCPFCDNAVFLEADIDAYRFFRCDGCSKTSCRRCRGEFHTGSCDPEHRAEEDETEKFIIRCFCGARFFRGDGCNKVQCPNCRKGWCWLCKANVGALAYLTHFRDISGPDDGRCPLYGERAADQVFAPRPAVAPVVRRRMDVDEAPDETLVLTYPCREEATRQPQPVLQAAAPRHQGNQTARCKATLKGAAQRPCPYKAKTEGYCGKHMHYFQPPAIAAVVAT